MRVDPQIVGGADWGSEIEEKLRVCDIFILLVSVNSMASSYIVDKEIAIIRERQKKVEHVRFYPLVLTPTPEAGLNKVRDKNLRPRGAKPFSAFSLHERMQHMMDAANEIARIADEIVEHKRLLRPGSCWAGSTYVHLSGLPETEYEKLAGRHTELKRLDEDWNDSKINIVSLVGEGGAGKSALMNEWLKRLQADNYGVQALSIGTGSVRRPLAPPDMKNPSSLFAPRQDGVSVPNNLAELAGAIADDPPDAASFLTYVVLRQPLPDPAHPGSVSGNLVRLNPIVQPVLSPSGEWMSPPGLTLDQFAAIADLDTDAVEPSQVDMIRNFGEQWLADKVANQPIRSNSLHCEIGQPIFSQAKLAWNGLKL